MSMYQFIHFFPVFTVYFFVITRDIHIKTKKKEKKVIHADSVISLAYPQGQTRDSSQGRRQADLKGT